MGKDVTDDQIALFAEAIAGQSAAAIRDLFHTVLPPQTERVGIMLQKLTPRDGLAHQGSAGHVLAVLAAQADVGAAIRAFVGGVTKAGGAVSEFVDEFKLMAASAKTRTDSREGLELAGRAVGAPALFAAGGGAPVIGATAADVALGAVSDPLAPVDTVGGDPWDAAEAEIP
jgi:hypothetical protein